LRRYCQCFAGQLVCSDSCRCENCYNSAEHGVERRAAVRELLCRSPHAFDAKFKTEVGTVVIVIPRRDARTLETGARGGVGVGGLDACCSHRHSPLRLSAMPTHLIAVS
ncbi:unnamed protein product, partial [Ectocarpus sp. 12 AP-2014]